MQINGVQTIASWPSFSLIFVTSQWTKENNNNSCGSSNNNNNNSPKAWWLFSLV